MAARAHLVTLIRLGVLAMIVWAFFVALATPLSTHWSAWWAQNSILALLVALGVAGFGCYAALGGRPLLKDWLEE